MPRKSKTVDAGITLQTKSKPVEAGIALGTAVAVFAGEFFFRHYLTFWYPVLGSRVVNDSLSILLFYGLMLAAAFSVLHLGWGKELANTGRALFILVSKWQGLGWLLLGVVALAVVPFIDGQLWGQVSLPIIATHSINSTVWLVSQTGALVTFSHLLINALLFPFAEEFVWRGIVQVRLARALPVWLAIGLTSLLFTLKYTLVNASLGQLLAMTLFSVVCGIVAAQKNWHHSAALSMFASFVTTVITFALGSGQ